MRKQCPKCGSGHIDGVDYMGKIAVICLSCGYDESIEIESGARTNQKAKGSHSPYHTGGGARSRK